MLLLQNFWGNIALPPSIPNIEQYLKGTILHSVVSGPADPSSPSPSRFSDDCMQTFNPEQPGSSEPERRKRQRFREENCSLLLQETFMVRHQNTYITMWGFF